MQILDHVSITVTDLARATPFYEAISTAEVRAFFAAGLRAGGIADGEPGLRPNYHRGYFAAFLKDPEGNRVEAVFHRGESET